MFCGLYVYGSCDSQLNFLIQFRIFTRLKAEIELPLVANGTSPFAPRVVAMGAGHLHPPLAEAKNLMGPSLVEYKNVVILASDWTVFCLSSSLRLKWSKKIAPTPPDELLIKYGQHTFCIHPPIVHIHLNYTPTYLYTPTYCTHPLIVHTHLLYTPTYCICNSLH